MKKSRWLISAAMAFGMLFAGLVGCETVEVEDGVDPNIAGGIKAWNSKNPEKARAWWLDIEDAKAQKKWLGYIATFDEGVTALENVETVTSESKKLTQVKKAMTKFQALDKDLKLPGNVVKKGVAATAPRIYGLLEGGDPTAARKLYNTAKSVYGDHSEFDVENDKITVVNAVNAKRADLKAAVDAANAIEDVDEKIEAYNKLITKSSAAQRDVNSTIAKSGFGDVKAVVDAKTKFTKIGQDVTIKRQAAIREKAYDYKERISEVFARQMPTNGSGKNGALTNKEILGHYSSVDGDMEKIYAQLLEFQKLYPNEIDMGIINDINAQKKTLKSKIEVVQKEVAREEEIASRGKYVGIIGLFNPDSRDKKKSRPAKFSGSTALRPDYLWGMVDVAKGAKNDLVIKVSDNRPVAVYNKNTKSGSQIKALGLQNLVSMKYQSGTSWPVINVTQALGGSVFYIEVGKGSTAQYTGEAIIYDSFISRSR